LCRLAEVLRDLLNEEGIRMARDRTERELAKIDEVATILDASEHDELSRAETPQE
jgi:hypothetical protein